MPSAVKKNSNIESAEDRERILHSIAQRWHGDLTAYLEAVSKLREATAATEDVVEQPITHSLLSISRRR